MLHAGTLPRIRVDKAADYEDAAVVIPQPGTEARGEEELRRLYGTFMKPGTSVKQLKTHVVEPME